MKEKVESVWEPYAFGFFRCSTQFIERYKKAQKYQKGQGRRAAIKNVLKLIELVAS